MDDVIRGTADAAAEPRGILLDLAPLLAPYAGRKNLSLRVERLPARARLSKGSNNGDGTWSLRLDDLDDLRYLPANNKSAVPALSLRVFTRDDDYATTLAVLDIPIHAQETAPPASASAPSLKDDAELHRQLDELVALKAAQEAAFAEAKQKAEADHAAARAAWDAELDRRVAAVAADAATKLERHRAEWQAEQQTHLAQVEKDLRARGEQAREQWRQEADAALAKAKKVWHAEEAARLTAAEAKWREAANRALAEAKTHVKQAETARAEAMAQQKHAHDRRDDELARLRDELAATRAIVSERDAALAAMRQQAQHTESAATKQKIEAELTAARTAWEAELKTRLAQATAEATQSLGQSRAAWQAEQADRLAATEKSALERQEKAHKLWQQEADAILGKAKEAWHAEEATRLAAAEAKWRDETSRAVAAATARVQAAEKTRDEALAQRKPTGEGRDPELSRLRDELAAMRQRAEHAEGPGIRQQVETALAEARKTWHADEAKRFSAAETAWHEKTNRLLGEMKARLDQAEAARAAAVTQRQPTPHGIDEELSRLRDELAASRAIVSDRESELIEMRQRGAQVETVAMRQKIEAELAIARSGWEAELESRLAGAAAEATRALEQNRAAWEVERASRVTAWEKVTQQRLQQAQTQWLQENEASLAKTREEWKTAEAARLAAEREQWQAQAATALAEATARFERAEKALAERDAQPLPANSPRDQAELHQLRDELGAIQASLAEREAELVETRATAEQLREAAAAATKAAAEKKAATPQSAKVQPRPTAPPAKAAAQPTGARGTLGDAIKRRNRARLTRHLVRGGALAACLAVGLVLYPYVASIVADDVTPRIAALSERIAPLFERAPAEPQEPEPAHLGPPDMQIVEHRTIIGVPVAMVRSGPSPAAPIISKLPRDRDVSPVDRRGSWVLIRFDDEDGKFRQEGWVSAALLKSVTGP